MNRVSVWDGHVWSVLCKCYCRVREWEGAGKKGREVMSKKILLQPSSSLPNICKKPMIVVCVFLIALEYFPFHFFYRSRPRVWGPSFRGMIPGMASLRAPQHCHCSGMMEVEAAAKWSLKNCARGLPPSKYYRSTKFGCVSRPGWNHKNPILEPAVLLWKKKDSSLLLLVFFNDHDDSCFLYISGKHLMNDIKKESVWIGGGWLGY